MYMSDNDVQLDPGEYEAFYGTPAAPGERIAYDPFTNAYTALGNASNLLDYYSQYGSVPTGGVPQPQTSSASEYSVSGYFGGTDTEGYRKYQEGKRAGKWNDLPDFIAKGGNQSGDLPKDPVDAMIEAAEKRYEEEKSFLDQYVADNPFVFDEELARESATAEYEPYYTELLDDWLQEAEIGRETIEDDRNLLRTLQEYETGAASREYARAVSEAEQGFAGKGMFFSGIKKRNLGEGEVEKVAEDELRTEKYGYRQRGLERKEELLDIDESRQRRDIGREQEAAIEGGILQRYGEQQKAYNVPFVQSYQRRFGTGNTLLEGYLVPEYLRY